MIDPLLSLVALLVVVVLAVAVFLPGRGLAGRWIRGAAAVDRVVIEDALKHLWDCEYRGLPASLESLSGALDLGGRRAAAVLERLERLELVRHDEQGLHLTAEGARHALRVVRIHRLWERYLADETGLDPREWHARAERREHLTTDAEAQALSASLGHPRFDPHGDPIPMADGGLPPHEGVPLTQLTPDQAGVIVHLEDEPEAVFAQIAAAGLAPGMRIRVLDRSPHRLRLATGADEVVLAPVVAANVTVSPIETAAEGPPPTPLSALAPGGTGIVTALASACRGAQRRRLLDLGLVPGTLVAHEFSGPSGDPTAYRIRGALVALRSDQAALIYVRPNERAAS